MEVYDCCSQHKLLLYVFKCTQTNQYFIVIMDDFIIMTLEMSVLKQDTPATSSWKVSESEPCMLAAVHLYWPLSNAVGWRMWSSPELPQNTLQTDKENVFVWFLCFFVKCSCQSEGELSRTTMPQEARKWDSCMSFPQWSYHQITAFNSD